MGDTKIEWTDFTWNPIRGCSKVSSGCQNCFAERMAARFSKPGEAFHGTIKNGRWNGNVKLIEKALELPLRWRKPRRIFVNSMSDLFHENVKDEWIDRIFAVMALCPQHTFQILTKRAERMLDYLRPGLGPTHRIWILAGKQPSMKWPLPNVWLGVSVEDQKTANERIPLLLSTPAAVRFVSAEPLLSAIDFSKWIGEKRPGPISQIIVGGESGPNARPMHPDWVRSIRDQCVAAGVPFFFKGWGEWAPYDRSLSDGSILATPYSTDLPLGRIGKKLAGRMLDGRTWDEFPDKREMRG